jgi:hypothetical protein
MDVILPRCIDSVEVFRELEYFKKRCADLGISVDEENSRVVVVGVNDDARVVVYAAKLLATLEGLSAVAIFVGEDAEAVPPLDDVFVIEPSASCSPEIVDYLYDDFRREQLFERDVSRGSFGRRLGDHRGRPYGVRRVGKGRC